MGDLPWLAAQAMPTIIHYVGLKVFWPTQFFFTLTLQGDDFEGGTRVCAFATGGIIPKRLHGSRTSGFIHIADWYATFASLAGN